MQTTTKTGKRSRVFYGWYIVGASVALNFYLSLAFFNGFQVFFLPILREFKWTRALTSGAFSLRQVETGLLAPAIGFLVDRWGATSGNSAGCCLQRARDDSDGIHQFRLDLLPGVSHHLSWDERSISRCFMGNSCW